MPEDNAQVLEQTLRSASSTNEMRSKAWKAFYGAKNKQEFDQQFDQIDLPLDTKKALFRMKFPAMTPPPPGPAAQSQAPPAPAAPAPADSTPWYDRPMAPLSKIVPQTDSGTSSPVRAAAGLARGVMQGAESMTTPKNIGLMGAMAGAEAIPYVGGVVNAVAPMVFTAGMAKNIIDSIPDAQKAWKAKDWDKLGSIVGSDVVEALIVTKGGKRIMETFKGKPSPSKPTSRSNISPAGASGSGGPPATPPPPSSSGGMAPLPAAPFNQQAIQAQMAATAKAGARNATATQAPAVSPKPNVVKPMTPVPVRPPVAARTPVPPAPTPQPPVPATPVAPNPVASVVAPAAPQPVAVAVGPAAQPTPVRGPAPKPSPIPPLPQLSEEEIATRIFDAQASLERAQRNAPPAAAGPPTAVTPKPPAAVTVKPNAPATTTNVRKVDISSVAPSGSPTPKPPTPKPQASTTPTPKDPNTGAGKATPVRPPIIGGKKTVDQEALEAVREMVNKGVISAEHLDEESMAELVATAKVRILAERRAAAAKAKPQPGPTPAPPSANTIPPAPAGVAKKPQPGPTPAPPVTQKTPAPTVTRKTPQQPPEAPVSETLKSPENPPQAFLDALKKENFNYDQMAPEIQHKALEVWQKANAGKPTPLVSSAVEDMFQYRDRGLKKVTLSVRSKAGVISEIPVDLSADTPADVAAKIAKVGDAEQLSIGGPEVDRHKMKWVKFVGEAK